jgi:hypothetical protein
LFSRFTRPFLKRADATEYVRMALSPAVAFLLFSSVTRAGWVSTQVLYAREMITVNFLGAYDTWCWILLTIILALVAASYPLQGPDQSARFLSLVLIASVLVFGFSILFRASALAIMTGAVIYFMDLLVPKRSSAFVKILCFFAPLTCAFVLDILAELVYPASLHSQRSSLPWLLSSSTQLATAAYHVLDPAVPLLYGCLLLLPFALFLVSLSVRRRILDNLPRHCHEPGIFTFLGVALMLCGFAWVVLFIPFVVTGRPVGVDFHWYINGVSTLTRVGILPTLASFSHPMTLLAAAMIGELFQVTPELAVQIFTVFVAVLAGAAAAWTSLQATNSRAVALLSLLFSLFSIRATVGYSAGILANWLALGEGLVVFGLLARFLRLNRRRDLAMALVVNVALFATHFATWVMLSVVTLLLLGLRRKRALFGLGGIFTVLVLVSTAIPEVQLSQVVSTFAFRSPEVFLGHLQTLSQLFIFGLFTDPAILILSILGITYASFVLLSHDWKYMILTWSALTGALVLFLSPEFAWRALYQVPYEILAALGAYFVWLVCVGSGPRTTLRNSLAATILLAICLATIANGVRAVLVLL